MTKEYDSVVIDAMNLCYRSWWACRELVRSDGIHTGMEFGFLKNFLFLARIHLPSPLVLAWDGRPTRALNLYSDYKGNRKKSSERDEAPWPPRINRLREALQDLVLNLYERDSEADEEIARYITEQETQGKRTLILSNDGDLCQLVSDKTQVWNPAESSPMDSTGVVGKFGVLPEQVPLLRAMSGDRSDNIPGVKNLPTVVKVRLVQESEDLDSLLKLCANADWLTKNQRTKLIEGQDIIRRNFELMNLRGQRTASSQFGSPKGDTSAALALCHELELAELLQRREWSLFQPIAPGLPFMEVDDGPPFVLSG